MSDQGRHPGWDAQAIRDIVAAHYGKLIDLFVAHEWPERGAAMMPAQQARIASHYGSVEAFVQAHSNGITGNAILNPRSAIAAETPDVWLTSYYGFTPENWGFLGFTQENMRKGFLRQSRPGALVVVYGAGGAIPSERKKVLGIQQQSHVLGTKWDFVSPERAKLERADPERENKWLYGVKSIRAWRIPPESRPDVAEFFPDTYSHNNATVIGSRGLRVSAAEAQRLLKLDLVEVYTWGGQNVDALVVGPAERVLAPSRPGPISQSPYMVREAEGPKHLYILRLHGNAHHFMGDDVGEQMIVKVGLSRSPSTRCDALNGALPKCAFNWEILHSTSEGGRAPFPNSRHALAVEQVMKDLLRTNGTSRGGEFFLASRSAVDDAWLKAVDAARKYSQ